VRILVVFRLKPDGSLPARRLLQFDGASALKASFVRPEYVALQNHVAEATRARSEFEHLGAPLIARTKVLAGVVQKNVQYSTYVLFMQSPFDCIFPVHRESEDRDKVCNVR
jgi:hypothetical protein